MSAPVAVVVALASQRMQVVVMVAKRRVMRCLASLVKTVVTSA
jgi:hypothetical protein